MQHVIGEMAKGHVVHLGRYVKKIEGFALYEPACSRLQQFRHIAYLLHTQANAPTCRKCLRKVKDGDTFLSVRG
jgi:hypothetical protein